MKKKEETRQPFIPVRGLVYTNIGGGDFKCIQYYPDVPEAMFQNVKSGWTFMAHHPHIYVTGEIDWNYSTGGRFEKIAE